MPAADGDKSDKSSELGNQSSTMTEPSPSTGSQPDTPPHLGNVFYFRPSESVRKFAKQYRTEIAASTASVISTFTAFPLDFAKSRMQSYETGFMATIKDAYKMEGVRAFWRGVGPPLISVTVVRTISFSLYQKTKYALDSSIHKLTGQSPLAIANATGSYPTLSTMLCFGTAGATAGAIITVLSCPFELTKLNEQLAGKMAREAVKRGAGQPGTVSEVFDIKSKGSWATARRLARERGLAGLYAGYRLHLLRDTLGTAMYFTTYESAKQLLGNARGKSATSPYAVVVAGGLCGIVSWACIYPIDVAKTVYQKSLLSAASGQTVSRPTIRFFEFSSYRGLGVSVARSCIINMIFFSNFELMKKQINAL